MADESTHEWEVRVGQQVRALRIARMIEQAELARRANLSIGTIQSLERGAGSSLKTIVRVVRALDRTDWLDSLDPRGDGPSPMEQLRLRRRQPGRPQRVRRSL